MDRLVKLTLRVKRRHYEALSLVARASGHLTIAGWLRTLLSPHLFKK